MSYHYSPLSVTEPHSGFRIAFNMFDTDGNQRVDKDEFLVVSYLCFVEPVAKYHCSTSCYTSDQFHPMQNGIPEATEYRSLPTLVAEHIV